MNIKMVKKVDFMTLNQPTRLQSRTINSIDQLDLDR